MAVNSAYIDEDTTWFQMTLDELKEIDGYDCSSNMKENMKEFFINKIEKGYFFTYDIQTTEVDYDGFEYFIGYKEKEDGEMKIRKFCEYNYDNCYDDVGPVKLWGDDDDDW